MAENKWVAGVKIPISGDMTLLTTGRGPSCRYYSDARDIGKDIG